ncbi:MAG: plastocyanin/azurin family copper-binding protein [Microthrixaceae bacterium]
MFAKKLGPVAAGVCALILVSGCGSSDASAKASDKASGASDTEETVNWTDKTGQGAVEIDARDNSFNAKFVTVSPGTKVTFDNKGRNPHNVIAVDKGKFETVEVQDFQPGDTDVRTFDEPGEYAYYCSLHGTPTKGMVGRIKVVE